MSCVRVTAELTKLTHVRNHLICSSLHHFVIVPPPELGKRRQSRDLHPHLEMFVAGQLRELGITIGVSSGPVRRW